MCVRPIECVPSGVFFKSVSEIAWMKSDYSLSRRWEFSSRLTYSMQPFRGDSSPLRACLLDSVLSTSRIDDSSSSSALPVFSTPEVRSYRTRRIVESPKTPVICNVVSKSVSITSVAQIKTVLNLQSHLQHQSAHALRLHRQHTPSQKTRRKKGETHPVSFTLAIPPSAPFCRPSFPPSTTSLSSWKN